MYNIHSSIFKQVLLQTTRSFTYEENDKLYSAISLITVLAVCFNLITGNHLTKTI